MHHFFLKGDMGITLRKPIACFISWFRVFSVASTKKTEFHGCFYWVWRKYYVL